MTIETKELEISKDLKRKVEMICKFACAKPTITGKEVKSISIILIFISKYLI